MNANEKENVWRLFAFIGGLNHGEISGLVDFNAKTAKAQRPQSF